MNMLESHFARCGREVIQKSPSQARAFFIQARRSFSSTSRRNIAPQPLDSPEVRSAQAYCLDLLRKYDSPSYTLQNFIQPHIMPAYLAIRAFNIELARIPDIVSNPTVGTMRMQFWKNTIDSTFDGNPPAEPVAVLLGSFLAHSGIKLNKIWFHRIINTRDQALSNPGFTNIAAVETYAESTYSTLLYLTLDALKLKSLTIDHLASHIGKAAGISTVLRGVPLLAFPPPPNSHSSNPAGMGLPPNRSRQGVITLPLDVMSQCGVREEDIYRNGANATGLRDAIFTVATRASDHLITARSMLKNIKAHEDPSDHEFEHISDPGHEYTKYDQGVRQSSEKRKSELDRGFSVIMGPAVSTQLWLDRLQKVDFDIFHDSLRRAEWKLPAVAWWKNRNETF